MTEIVKPTGEKLKKWWVWLNGKKTNIAAGALLIIKALTMCGVPVPPQALEIIDLLFYSLLGIGLGHKAIKNKPAIKGIFNKSINNP